MASAEERAKRVEFPERFEIAVRYQERLYPLETTGELTVQQRLLLYALRQQAREGKNATPAPSWWQATDRAKWDAWETLGSMSTFEAMVYFTKTLEELRADWLLRQIEHEDGRSPRASPADAATPELTAAEERAEQARAVAPPGLPLSSAAPALAGVPGSQPLHVRSPQPRSPQRGSADVHNDVGTLQGLRRQVDNLQYRLACALRDVQTRDDLVAALRSENAAMRQLLSQHGVSPPAQSSSARPLLDALDRAHAPRPRPQTPHPSAPGGGGPLVVAVDDDAAAHGVRPNAQYYQRRQGWLTWLMGGDGGTNAAV